MFRFFWIALICLCSACAVKQGNLKQRSLLHLQLGTSHLSKGNYPAAMSELLKADELDPTNPQIKNNLGLAFWVREKYDRAAELMRDALALNPKYTEARNNLGRILIDQKKYSEAINVLKAAVDDLTYRSPEKSHSNLGMAYFMAGQYQAAKVHLRKSLELRQDSCGTFHLYGKALFELKEFRAAADSFDRSVELCKKDALDEPHYLAAVSYFKIGNREQAVARLEELMKLYPEGQYSAKAKAMLQILR